MTDNPFAGGKESSLNQKEFKLQVAVVAHLGSAFPGLLFTHVPNRPANAQDGFFKKQMGVRPGIPDLLFWWATEYYTRAMQLAYRFHGGAIELKTDAGRWSNDQNRFASVFVPMGGKFALCRSVKAVHETLMSWGLTPRHHAIQEPDYRSKTEKKADAFDFYKP